MKVFVLNGKFAIECSYMENDKVRSLPKREYKKKFRMWAVAPIYDNARELLAGFQPWMDAAAIELAHNIILDAAPPVVEGELPEWVIEDLLPHQQEAIRRAWPEVGFAILHRPRLRKTSTTIHLASARFLADQIDGLLVTCPNSIKSVWEKEFEKRAKCPYVIHVLNVKKDHKKKKVRAWLDSLDKERGKLHVFIVSVEGQASVGGQELAQEFVNRYGSRCMVAVDESTRIKNHQSQRTEAVWDLGAAAGYRNILTGSEITRAPSDLFSQFRFLGIHTLGYDSFYAFRNQYVLMGGFERKKEIGVKNVEELMAKITKFAHLVKTSDVVDLPEKTFEQRVIDPTDEQVRMVRELKKMMETTDGDEEITVKTAMTMMLRAQQIAGGYFPAIQEDGVTTIPVPLKKNPKLDELMDILDQETGKVVIWARFRPEIEGIRDKISEVYGPESVVTFYGGNSEDERTDNRISFQESDAVKYFVGNPTCGSMGLELSAASTMIYYSMDYTYESRVQSLERATNIEKGVGVGIIDLTLDIKPDHSIMEATLEKKDISEWVEDAVHSGRFSLID